MQHKAILDIVLELPDKEPKKYHYEFEQEIISIGRDTNNDIQVPLTTVSRRHAEIIYDKQEFVLKDLGSTHGTSINGKKIEKNGATVLRSGDVIEIVKFRITFAIQMLDDPIFNKEPGDHTEVLAHKMAQEVLKTLDSSQNVHPSLRVLNGPAINSTFVFTDDYQQVSIGRNPDCDFQVQDPNISRKHALIKKDWNGYSIQDLGSKNGVIVNGTKIEVSKILHDRDEIVLGAVKLVFLDPAAALFAGLGGVPSQQPHEATKQSQMKLGADKPIENISSHAQNAFDMNNLENEDAPQPEAEEQKLKNEKPKKDTADIAILIFGIVIFLVSSAIIVSLFL